MRIRIWIDENIDDLWYHEKKARIEKDPEFALLQEEKEFKEKKKHKVFLLDQAEKMLKERRGELNLKNVHQLHTTVMSKNLTYEKKIKFLETKIEEYLTYFNQGANQGNY